VQGTAKLGAMTGARGCITSPGANQYLISIAWQGVQASGAPANTCGQNAYSNENMRRTVTTVVQIATLAS
ncbi:MAG: type IV pilus modification protein PilV, partial [Polaromonas sp.]